MNSLSAEEDANYVPYKVGSDFGVKLYLPQQLASELGAAAEILKIERRRQENDRDASERRAQEIRMKALAREAAPVTRDPLARIHMHEFEMDRHQVLVDAGKVAQRLKDIDAGIQGDTESAKREKFALSLALKFGADRSVIRRAGWKGHLDALAREMPAFKNAIDAISNAYAISVATGRMPRIQPLLLVGPPGVGKSYFCRRLIETLALDSKWIGMDTPSAGSQLRGSDKYWSNSTHGVLFDLLAIGKTANPVVILDELDKVGRNHSSNGINPLAQLHATLEQETARRINDVSLDVELDASLVLYVATANGVEGIDAPLLSRFNVVLLREPDQAERRESAGRIVATTLSRLGLAGMIKVTSGAVVILAEYSPRVAVLAIEKAVGAAVEKGAKVVAHDEIEAALGISSVARPRLGLVSIH